MINLIRILPLIGVLLLVSVPTSADLNDEVTLKSNQIKATSKSLEIQNTVDSSRLTYFFNLDKFQSDSLSATSLRIRNTGKVIARYFMTVKLVNADEICRQPKLKIFKDDEIIFNNLITELDIEMPNVEPGQKIDLVLLMSLNGADLKSSAICDYRLEIATEKANQNSKGLWDRKSIEGKLGIVDIEQAN